ncbi:MAG: pantetheine-phosphate adenylyltransferase [Spirochaetaceae bacterium]|nr:pantetheine-phosphate adenylyltransferase [Spirochaetaceae bacterium]
MAIALFPGSFDPPTYGHLNIIERARTIFDKIDVVIAVNKSKKYLFSEEERLSMIRELVSGWDNVTVHTSSRLIVDYAHENNASVLLRGVRNFSDFSYEFDLSLLNKGLASDIETVFLPTDPEFFVLRSSSIKELAAFNGDISKMVPPLVEKALKEKYGIVE